MEYKPPEEIAANTASVLSWQKHLRDKALKSKMRAARCPSTHCERRQECTSPHECSVTSIPA
jgi:hypothetical protein